MNVMRRIGQIFVLLSAPAVVGNLAVATGENLNAPPEEILAWRDLKFGMFVHLSLIHI